ncbi:hypothetical protein [Clostridium estertheticum]|uniref:Uncharacterized protein n=1 Tax=Clostridium estertheticum TaxID=238834 RepID=A0AA47EJI4_9CLOT|nr:hypothetical protein [Clostridium estertheticum]MBU3153888.1 hypothetical protein [Clostridium estertheticum]WAG61336.1 hypothetical protein LL038_03525 [Clostridium estertheticum]
MAGEIYIADKATLDLVKADTTTIKANESTIVTNVASVKSDTSSLVANAPINWDRASSNTITNALVTCNVSGQAYVTALQITGKGLLKKSLIRCSGSSMHGIRITVDGVVKVVCNNSSGSSMSVTGFTCEELFQNMYNSLDLVLPFGNGLLYIQNPMLGYPSTTSTAGIVRSAKPIYFNSSLLVEVHSNLNPENIEIENSYIVL